jgi:hypothetical protein
MPPTPQFTFFCELDTPALVELFADPNLIPTLQAIPAGVSLGLLDLSSERAEVVLRCNRAGIPVTAWLLLPREQGYWFNLENAPQAEAFYADFLRWTQAHQLAWDGIGLDIEPDIRLMKRLVDDRRTALNELFEKLMDSSQAQRAAERYVRLVERIRADGFRTEAYQIPLIVDERMAGTRLLSRVAGLVSLPVDREVLMLYSSYLRPLGMAALASYGAGAGGVGLGITGGGVKLEGDREAPPLDWPELERDIHLAAHHSPHLYIFSLEGCLQQGMLPRFANLPVRSAPQVEPAARRKLEAIRAALRTVLWLFEHPLEILGAAIAGLLVGRLLRRR